MQPHSSEMDGLRRGYVAVVSDPDGGVSHGFSSLECGVEIKE